MGCFTLWSHIEDFHGQIAGCIKFSPTDSNRTLLLSSCCRIVPEVVLLVEQHVWSNFSIAFGHMLAHTSHVRAEPRWFWSWQHAVLEICHFGISINGGIQNGHFIMEIPFKWMLWGYPYFRKPIFPIAPDKLGGTGHSAEPANGICCMGDRMPWVEGC